MAEGRVPVVDLGPWYEGSKAGVVAAVKEACSKVGFFTIVNHRIPSTLVREAFGVSKAFFDMPLEHKQKTPMTPTYPYGYEAQETLSASIDDKGYSDLKETFQLSLRSSELIWPTAPAQLQPVLTAYYEAMAALASDLMEVFALALDLPRNWFHDKINRHNSALRTLNYPHQEAQPKEGQLRASAHSDYGSLTILAVQDKIGCLQVQNRDGSWQTVVPPGDPADAFIVNLGDLMAVWTNDCWKSTVHRVTNPPLELQDTRRQSIAFFHNPNEDAVVECIPSCQSPSHPPKYPATTAGAHLWSKHSKATAQ